MTIKPPKKAKVTLPVPPPPFSAAMNIKPPGYIPPAPKFNPQVPKTKEDILNALKGHIRQRMKKVPPPPFSKAMTVKLPPHIPKAPKW